MYNNELYRFLNLFSSFFSVNFITKRVWHTVNGLGVLFLVIASTDNKL